MKRVKKMVAMATVMTMVFNVVMPIGVLAKENTNEYGVLAKNGANFSGSGQIIGDIVINNGTLKYKTEASHAFNIGSIPVRVTICTSSSVGRATDS